MFRPPFTIGSFNQHSPCRAALPISCPRPALRRQSSGFRFLKQRQAAERVVRVDALHSPRSSNPGRSAGLATITPTGCTRDVAGQRRMLRGAQTKSDCWRDCPQRKHASQRYDRNQGLAQLRYQIVAPRGTTSEDPRGFALRVNRPSGVCQPLGFAVLCSCC